MSNTTFTLFAGTNIGLRPNNEDNFIVCPDLSSGEWIVPEQMQLQLGPQGCLMVVADGMGGQNAGEVASAIAIDTVRRMFDAASLPADIANAGNSHIHAFMKRVIQEADRQVKLQATAGDGTREGMGSTIVMAWLIGDEVHVAWLGDSRAYSLLPSKGISRLTRDHSYVQDLVDDGELTEEQAMEHPDSNIVTRSLGDTSKKAQPGVVAHKVEKGEVLLLCTDGLHGVLTDQQIGDIAASQLPELSACKEALTQVALDSGSSDNITVALLQVMAVGDTHVADDAANSKRGYSLMTNIIGSLVALFIILALCIAGYKLLSHGTDATTETAEVETEPEELPVQPEDTVAVLEPQEPIEAQPPTETAIERTEKENGILHAPTGEQDNAQVADSSQDLVTTSTVSGNPNPNSN